MRLTFTSPYGSAQTMKTALGTILMLAGSFCAVGAISAPDYMRQVLLGIPSVMPEPNKVDLSGFSIHEVGLRILFDSASVAGYSTVTGQESCYLDGANEVRCQLTYPRLRLKTTNTVIVLNTGPIHLRALSYFYNTGASVRAVKKDEGNVDVTVDFTVPPPDMRVTPLEGRHFYDYAILSYSRNMSDALKIWGQVYQQKLTELATKVPFPTSSRS
ncbi:uncharacterized protein LOC144178686 [Haemaphysalis longicornis]